MTFPEKSVSYPSGLTVFYVDFFSVSHYLQIGTEYKLLDDIQTFVPSVLFLDTDKAVNDIH